MAAEIINAPVLVLVGPTAIGKTELSLTMAKRFDCEIISVDSMQIYRYMDIGTAKPSLAEQTDIRHHLIDIVDPDEQYDASRFVTDALQALRSIMDRGKTPLLTGGTGLYLKALTSGLFDTGSIDSSLQESVRKQLYSRLEKEGREVLFKELKAADPETAGRIHQNDTQRLVRALELYQLTGSPWSKLINKQPRQDVVFENLLQLGLNCERELLYDRIGQRSRQMMAQGLVAEVEKLREMGYTSSLQSMQAIGYRHVNNCLDGIWDLDETVGFLVRDTRRYAKRQMTWFSRITALRWYDREAGKTVLQDTENWLNSLHHS